MIGKINMSPCLQIPGIVLILVSLVLLTLAFINGHLSAMAADDSLHSERFRKMLRYLLYASLIGFVGGMLILPDQWAAWLLFVILSSFLVTANYLIVRFTTSMLRKLNK
jgi:hypothetical protein